MIRIVITALLVAFALPAMAQNTFPTPGGQFVEGTQMLCQNSAGKSVACGSGGGGGSIPIVVNPMTYTGSPSASVDTTSGTLVAAGAYTRSLQVCTTPTSTTNVWLNTAGAAAVANTGIPVFAGGGCAAFGGPALPLPTAAITAITDGAVSQTVTLAGG